VVITVQDDGAPPLSHLAALSISIQQSTVNPGPEQTPLPESESTPQPVTNDNADPEEEGTGSLHWGLLLALMFLQMFTQRVFKQLCNGFV